MELKANISTNIIRDQNKELEYIVTPNTKEIFRRIFSEKGINRSFNLIGNYGTGKSTFLWALERNLNREKIYFDNIDKDVSGYQFIKIVGQNKSFAEVFSQELNLKGVNDQEKILTTLNTIRDRNLKNGKGLIVIIDEFGKFLENAAKNKSFEDLFLLQQIAEWANDDRYETYFIITLHQNFTSYGDKLSPQDRNEWEKVKGRFKDLTFNEPIEQLIFFASKKLESFKIPKELKARVEDLSNLVAESNLVNYNNEASKVLSSSLFPLDWLSANILVGALQRYGQNERSLFSFLNDNSKYSIQQRKRDFYTVSDVFDYLINTMPNEIRSGNNPHRPQWHSTFKALERAELYFEDNYGLASEVIKSIGLINVFSKAGGLLDKEFLVIYFNLTREADVRNIIQGLEKAGIIRFYKHSNKINFLEGTDIDLEQELILAAKEINPDFSVSHEITSIVDFPILLAKRYSFETGTPRFFEYKILNALSDVKEASGVLDGYINLIFFKETKKNVLEISKESLNNIFVIYRGYKDVKNVLFEIKKYDFLIQKFKEDRNALKLLKEEKNYFHNKLKDIVLKGLFKDDSNSWIHNGKSKKISNRQSLYNWLTKLSYKIYPETPVFINELINKEFLSAPINSARKFLIREVIENETAKDLALPENKFPSYKAIYLSLLEETGIHSLDEELGYYKLSKPPRNSNLRGLWEFSEDFMLQATSGKRKLNEFYELLQSPPFKMKKGFVEFWVPMFLLAKKEDYALFHKNGGYIPFLDEDTIDLIHKKPKDFYIKTYDVSGLKLNLLESYKELVQIQDDNIYGIQTTFLSIFSNFLRFYRSLNNYALKTKKLSNKAIALRQAIADSKDPEDALFEKFPNALGFSHSDIKNNEEVLKSYSEHIQEAIREIRSAYSELLDRVEYSITEAFYCESQDFVDYKIEIENKINNVSSYSLGSTQKIFFKRLVSPLDDRNSWLKSVADVALGKGLEELLDEEEPLLMKNIGELALGLIKASDLQTYNASSENGKLYSIRFFGESGEFVDDTLVIGNHSENVNSIKNDLSKLISNLTSIEKKEVLIELLSKELYS